MSVEERFRLGSFHRLSLGFILFPFLPGSVSLYTIAMLEWSQYLCLHMPFAFATLSSGETSLSSRVVSRASPCLKSWLCESHRACTTLTFS